MSMCYISDELIIRIHQTGIDKTKFIREAVEEKLASSEQELPFQAVDR